MHLELTKGQRKRREAVLEAVDGLLADNPQCAAIAQDAEVRGADRHVVRECLGRALLFGMWYFSREGTGLDNDGMAERFRTELKKVEGSHA